MATVPVALMPSSAPTVPIVSPPEASTKASEVIFAALVPAAMVSTLLPTLVSV